MNRRTKTLVCLKCDIGKILRKWHLAVFEPPLTPEELYDRFPGLLKMQVCKSLNQIQQGRKYSSDQIQELVQDVWAHIAEKESLLSYDKERPTSRPVKAFTGWTQRVTHNHIINVLKKESQDRFAKTVDEAEFGDDEYSSTTITYVQSEDPNQLQRILEDEHIQEGSENLDAFFLFLEEHCSDSMVKIYKALAVNWMEDTTDDVLQGELRCTLDQLLELKHNLKELFTVYMASCL